jgi:tetratricopeptide (TPR) repeat protein
MVDNRDSMYKQSPTHEERGKNIHRVPDLIIYSNKNEINRIVESPVVSLEKDMLQIMEHKNYVPQYALANEIFKLLNNNTVNSLMSDKNNIATRLKNQSKNSAELNSLGYVWMAAGEMNEALLAFELNALLYPNDPNVYDSLGEINLKMNKTSEARKYYQQVLALQPSNENAKQMLERLK